MVGAIRSAVRVQNVVQSCVYRGKCTGCFERMMYI
jgi:hypothetical protein